MEMLKEEELSKLERSWREEEGNRVRSNQHQRNSSTAAIVD